MFWPKVQAMLLVHPGSQPLVSDRCVHLAPSHSQVPHSDAAPQLSRTLGRSTLISRTRPRTIAMFPVCLRPIAVHVAPPSVERYT